MGLGDYFRGLNELLRNRAYVMLLLLYMCAWTGNVVLQSNLLLFCKYAINLYSHFPYVLGSLFPEFFVLGVLSGFFCFAKAQGGCLVSAMALIGLYTWLSRFLGKKLMFAIGLAPSLAIFTAVYWVPAEEVIWFYTRK